MRTQKKNMTTGLPSWAKGVIAVAVVGSIGFIAYKIYRKIKEEKEQKGSKEENKKAASELDDLIKKGIKPTYKPSQYESYANSLWEAMNGVGTTNDVVMRIFANLQNDADFLSLSNAYGIRTLSSGIFGVPDFRGSLSGAIASEIPNYKIKDINSSMKKKGITYKF